MKLTFELLKHKMKELFVMSDWSVLADEKDILVLNDGNYHCHFRRCESVLQEGMVVYRKQGWVKEELSQDSFEIVSKLNGEIVLGTVLMEQENERFLSSVEWYGLDEKWSRCKVMSRTNDIKRLENQFINTLLDLPELRLYAVTGLIQYKRK